MAAERRHQRGRERVQESIEGRRILVVGGSSGVGRSLGVQAAERGAAVAFAARRRELVAEAAEQAGGASVGLVCDVRDPDSCAAVVADTVSALGGLDALVFATAIDRLVRLRDADAADWRASLETNVVGAALVTAAALPHLRESKGRAVYVSASSIDRPLPGMGVYAATKYALETMVKGFQAEEPDLCFATVRIGSAMPTGVYESWDGELLAELSPAWTNLGYTHENGPGGAMTVEDAAASILGVVASPVWLREVTAVSDPGRQNVRY
jgi:NAD(P)-dependent dehydrogenase (short-subunit alcohol dehydrogenase family)